MPCLDVQLYNADPTSFHVSATLICGTTEAILVDTGFTRADAYRIYAMALASGRSLAAIYISQGDPDFYFGAQLLCEWFPGTPLIATEQTVARMQATRSAMLKRWAPALGAEAPQSVPMPVVVPSPRFQLDGEIIEVRGLDDMLAHRSYLWLPAVRTIVGGTNVYGGLHVCTAEMRSAAERAAWRAKLDEMEALEPERVVPGHMLPHVRQDVSQIRYTRDYLQRFEDALHEADDRPALVAAMRKAYPDAGLPSNRELGARVNMGEMLW